MPKARGLTPKQTAFVAEYLVDLNATQAAIRAGYSARTAEWQGPQLLGKPHVARAVEAAKARRAQRVEVTQDEVLRELRRIAFGDRRRLLKWGPGGVKLLESDELSDDDAAAVAEVSETISTNGGSVKIKTHDKVKALELLGKHIGLFEERSRVTVDSGVVVYLPNDGRG